MNRVQYYYKRYLRQNETNIHLFEKELIKIDAEINKRKQTKMILSTVKPAITESQGAGEHFHFREVSFLAGTIVCENETCLHPKKCYDSGGKNTIQLYLLRRKPVKHRIFSYP